MPRKNLTPARLEAFSDGVIAVIITIMVLELKVPHGNGLAGLHAIFPILLVYILSFTFTGIYWVNHHVLVDRIETADSRVLYANLVFLFCLSLLPFFTSWVLEKHIDRLSVVIYAASLCLTGAAFLLLRLAVERLLRLSEEHQQTDTEERRKHWISLALYLLSIPIALLHPVVALIVLAVVTLIWVLPGLGAHRSYPAPPRPNGGQDPSA